MSSNYKEDYEQSVETDLDITIHEDFNAYRYIDISLQRAKACLNKNDTESGFFQYVVIVNALEAEARAMNLLSSEYDEKIEKYIKSNEYNKEDFFKGSKNIKLANKKYSLIFEALAYSRQKSEPVIVKKSQQIEENKMEEKKEEQKQELKEESKPEEKKEKKDKT